MSAFPCPRRGVFRRSIAAISLVVVVAACSGTSDSAGVPAPLSSVSGDTGSEASATAGSEAPDTSDAAGTLEPATFTVQPGTEQVTVLGAEPGTELSLAGAGAGAGDGDGAGDGGGDGGEVAAGTVDEQGSLVLRAVAPGEYRLTSATETTEVFAVADRSDVPPAALYEDQDLLPAGGFGYIVTRDGTTLSANVVLPGPAGEGPYPTVVEYSGYAPSNPDDATFAEIYTTLGFAYVGVNMRG